MKGFWPLRLLQVHERRHQSLRKADSTNVNHVFLTCLIPAMDKPKYIPSETTDQTSVTIAYSLILPLLVVFFYIAYI